MSIISPYHDHNMFSHTYFYFLLYPQLKMSQYIVWSSVPSSPSGSGSKWNMEDLSRGGGKVIVRLLQEIPLVGEWLECGGVKWL